MIGPDQVVNCLTIAFIFLALGLVPGLLDALADGIVSVSVLLPWRPAPIRRPSRSAPGPRWFAVAGLVLIALTSAAYYAR